MAKCENWPERVEGACSACAAFLGATDDVKTAGVELIVGDNRIEGLGELPSLADRVAEARRF